eukprot:705420-Amorphochlora_amoeboformis.AAC.1
MEDVLVFIHLLDGVKTLQGNVGVVVSLEDDRAGKADNFDQKSASIGTSPKLFGILRRLER